MINVGVSLQHQELRFEEFFCYLAWEVLSRSFCFGGLVSVATLGVEVQEEMVHLKRCEDRWDHETCKPWAVG